MVNPTQNDLDILIRQYVSVASGLDSKFVIPGDDNHAAPVVPYATVKELTKVGSGIDSIKTGAGPNPLTQKTLYYKGRRAITYSIQFYKEGAADYAEGLIMFASTDAGQILLAQNGLTWEIAGPVQNLDAIMGSKFETRRAVDITLRYQSTNNEDVNAIGSAEIEMILSAEADLNEIIEVTDA